MTIKHPFHQIVRTHARLLPLALAIVVAGCDDTSTSYVGNPNALTLHPTGTIQGYLRDSVTQEPIVGAVIDIGVGSARTSATGQFVIANVPATNDSGLGTVTGAYQATIDLRNVVQATSAADYPDFAFSALAVNYTSLQDAAGAIGPDSATLSASNHDTPVTGLVASAALTVGKLAATINGIAYNAITRQPLGAGYNVKLVSTGSNQAGGAAAGSGAGANIVGSTITDASGRFSFANVESLQQFRLDVLNNDRSELGSENVRAPADGETKVLIVQNNDADTAGDDLQGVAVNSTDNVAPFVVSVSPEQNTDLAGGTVNVVFTFSESIRQSPSTDVSPSNPNGLYNRVDVNFTGMKASNIPHSLAWNSSFTQLTVTLPNLPASARFAVSLASAAGVLLDANDNALDLNSNATLVFTTNGAVMPAAPGAVAITNAAQLNQTGAPILDWLPVSGAKGYNIYRARNVAGASGTLVSLTPAAPITSSSFADSTQFFVDGQNPVSFDYVVKSVSFDNLESAGTSVSATDTVKPSATLVDFGPTPNSATKEDYRVCFSESMNEASVKALGNYSLGFQSGIFAPPMPTLDALTYNPATGCVLLTLSSPLAAGAHTLTASGMTDVSGNIVVLNSLTP